MSFWCPPLVPLASGAMGVYSTNLYNLLSQQGAEWLVEAAPGSVLLPQGRQAAKKRGARAAAAKRLERVPYVAVVAWTANNRAQCEDFAARLLRLSPDGQLVDALVSLELKLPDAAESARGGGVHEATTSSGRTHPHVAVERKLRLWPMLLQLLPSNRSAALLDCDVALFHRHSLSELTRRCNHAVCFMRETRGAADAAAGGAGRAWRRDDASQEVNSGIIVVPDATHVGVRALVRLAQQRLSAEVGAFLAGEVSYDHLYSTLRYAEQTVFNQLLHERRRGGSSSTISTSSTRSTRSTSSNAATVAKLGLKLLLGRKQQRRQRQHLQQRPDVVAVENLDWGVFDEDLIGYGCWALPTMDRAVVLAGHAVEVRSLANKRACLEAMDAWVSRGRLPDCRHAWRAPATWRRSSSCLEACPPHDRTRQGSGSLPLSTRCTCLVDREALPWYPRVISGAPFGFSDECEAVIADAPGNATLLGRIKQQRWRRRDHTSLTAKPAAIQRA